jgi:AraC-like DNA-binding protein
MGGRSPAARGWTNLAGERADYRVHADLGIEQILARFLTQRFPAHSHPAYLIGLTVEGAEEFVQEGSRGVSLPGQIRLINPGVVHAGGPPQGGTWSYEALYVPLPVLGAIAGAGEEHPPRFEQAVIEDPVLAQALRTLFDLLDGPAEASARRDLFTRTMRQLCAAHGTRTAAGGTRSEHHAVLRARAFLDANALSKIPLETLARQSGLSKFHLLRVFKERTGLTPWQYQVNVRLNHARRLLQRGEPASQVADACGFVDQSHFTRVFRLVMGVTPAVYASGYRTGPA